MKYNYQFTKDFETALDWVLSSQFKDNVSFRFTFESYRGDLKGPWLTPKQCRDYMRYLRVDDVFKSFTMRICA